MYNFIVNTAVFGAIVCFGAMGYWLFFYESDFNKLIKIINNNYGVIEKEYINEKDHRIYQAIIKISNNILFKKVEKLNCIPEYYLNNKQISNKVADVIETAIWKHNYEFQKLIAKTNDEKLEQSTKVILKEIVNGK